LLVTTDYDLIAYLLEIADAPVTTPQILSDLEHTQMVLLLSATTVTRQDFSKPEDWSREEKDKFTSKFTSFMPGAWHDTNSWKKLLKVSWREKLALCRANMHRSQNLTRKLRKLTKPVKPPTNESDPSLCAAVTGTKI
jgi:hypothetical protein